MFPKSYNVPYFPYIFNISGFPEYGKIKLNVKM